MKRIRSATLSHRDPRPAGIAAIGPYHRAALVDLNTLIPSGTGWNLQQTDAANDKGEIVGFGTLSGSTRGFILKPID